MKVAVFDTHKFERESLSAANDGRHNLLFLEARLTADSVRLATECQAVCCFTNDHLDGNSLAALKTLGIQLIALRSAGYNHLDVKKAQELSLTVVRVPAYSPFAVAEYAAGLILCLNRKIHKAYNRIHELNFSLEGLMGFDLNGKTVGVIGAGRIGKVFAKIMTGFGCQILANDKNPDTAWAHALGVQYTTRAEIFKQSDIISLHVPLSNETRHLIDADAIALMKKEVILVNTGRGALVDTRALIKALKLHSIGGACLDVYEEEENFFFSDFSEAGIDDDVLARLITFPQVLLASHQAFFTREAIHNIATTTISSLTLFEEKGDLSAVRVVN